jgi:hypothetical protein
MVNFATLFKHLCYSPVSVSESPVGATRLSPLPFPSLIRLLQLESKLPKIRRIPHTYAVIFSMTEGFQ